MELKRGVSSSATTSASEPANGEREVANYDSELLAIREAVRLEHEAGVIASNTQKQCIIGLLNGHNCNATESDSNITDIVSTLDGILVDVLEAVAEHNDLLQLIASALELLEAKNQFPTR